MQASLFRRSPKDKQALLWYNPSQQH